MSSSQRHPSQRQRRQRRLFGIVDNRVDPRKASFAMKANVYSEPGAFGLNKCRPMSCAPHIWAFESTATPTRALGS